MPQTTTKRTKTKKPMIKDRVYEQIRLDIITFQLEPGVRISEAQLAERLGVGIASIRAVLPKLIQEGLIINRRRLGHIIAPITMQDITNTNQLRQLLEPEAAEMATEKIDIELLEAIDERSKSIPIEDDQEAEIQSMLANREFHMAIADASGNERLSRWIGQLQDSSIRYYYLLRHSKPLHNKWEHSHEPIIEAFRTRDSKTVREQVLEHINEGHENLMKAVLTLPNVQSINIGNLNAE